MSIHSDSIAASGLPSLIDATGETISYTASGQAAKSISAIVVRDPIESLIDDDGEGSPGAIGISIHTDSTLGIVTVTENEDKVTVDSLVYTVRRIKKGTGRGVHRLHCVRYDREEAAVRPIRLERGR